MDEEEFESLAHDLPGLAAVGRFVQGLSAIPWFANLGEPISAGGRAAALRFADGLGFPSADIAIVPDWDDAGAAAENLDWNTPAWEAEELLRADVTARAAERLSEEAMTFCMAAAADGVSSFAGAAAEEAGSLGDVADEALRQLAVGAAVQAAHQAMLTLVAGEDPDFDPEDHPFTAKFQLFEFGRWPIGVAGQTFNIF
ncbi:MAG: hypothetical protein AAF224_06490 [Pseudomonadota bacterium]